MYVPTKIPWRKRQVGGRGFSGLDRPGSQGLSSGPTDDGGEDGLGDRVDPDEVGWRCPTDGWRREVQ